jgi:hypothetical protein
MFKEQVNFYAWNGSEQIGIDRNQLVDNTSQCGKIFMPNLSFLLWLHLRN